jgi:hypothetical protein
MNQATQSHRPLYWGLAFIAAVTGLLLLFAHNPSSPEKKADTRINRVHQFARLPQPTCDAIGTNSKLALYVNGMDTGLRGVGCTDSPKPTAAFLLRHERSTEITRETERAVWSVILGDPLETIGRTRTRAYDIVLPAQGTTTVQHLASPGSTFSFYIFEWWAPIAVGIVLLVWVLLVYLANRSALLRDAAVAGTTLEARTFSLGKTQMAWWFAIIFASFVFLWMTTGEMPTLSGQALSLLGISSVTTMASMGVGAGRTTDAGERDVFFQDILSDTNGISMARFQMVVMTAALGIIFLFEVATRLTMPQFDSSLLALLGISAGTYVGLKIPEGKDNKDSTDTKAAPDGAPPADPKAGYATTP